MRQINSLTNDASQQLTLILEDGTKVSMSIRYVENQSGWFYSLTYGDFSVNNRRLVNSPNMLRAFREFLGFGLMCTVLDGFEPVFQDDFTSGRVTLYTLNAQDILDTETLIVLTLPNFSGYPLS